MGPARSKGAAKKNNKGAAKKNNQAKHTTAMAPKGTPVELFNMIHKLHPLERKLDLRCSEFSMDFHKIHCWRDANNKSSTDWPETKEELQELGWEKKEVEAFKEYSKAIEAKANGLHDAWGRALLDETLEQGLEELASRLRKNPSVPWFPSNRIIEEANESVPKHVIHCDGRELIRHDDHDLLDEEYWQEYYPGLDSETIQALLAQVGDELSPNFVIMALGNYFVSQNWTNEQLQEWINGYPFTRSRVDSEPEGRMTRQKRAKLLASVTSSAWAYSMNCVYLNSLNETADTIEPIPLNELEEAARNVGIVVSTNHAGGSNNKKAAIVLALVEHIYTDVLEPRSA